MLTGRFSDALVAMATWHCGQRRKADATPYVSHPLQVAGIVLEHGADEDVAIAALLHDVLEDTGATHADLAERFGPRVADLVLACSDATTRPKPPWRARKERHLANLREAGPDVGLVVAADKIHNLRSLVGVLRARGEAAWESFRGGREGTLWYYAEVARVLRGRAPDVLVDEIGRLVHLLFDLAGRAPASPGPGCDVPRPGG